jgi:hypothetical protein
MSAQSPLWVLEAEDQVSTMYFYVAKDINESINEFL